MKFLALITISCLISLSASSNYSRLFSYNEEQLESALSALNELESYIAQSPGVNYSTLVNDHHPLLSQLNLERDEMPAFGRSDLEDPLGMPSFLWGCILGVTGVLVVYLVTEDKVETGKAAKGMFISMAAYVGGVIAIYAVVFVVYGGALFAFYGYY